MSGRQPFCRQSSPTLCRKSRSRSQACTRALWSRSIGASCSGEAALQIPQLARLEPSGTLREPTNTALRANLPIRRIRLLRSGCPFSAMAEPPQKRPVKFVASDQDGMPVKRRQVQQACDPCRKRKVRHGCRATYTALKCHCRPPCHPIIEYNHRGQHARGGHGHEVPPWP